MLLVAGLLLTAAPVASAATRYASPAGGTTEPCEESNPCSLPHAIEAAKEGDEVVVLDGATPYSISAPILPTVSLDIHGPAGAPIPEIDYTAKTSGAMLTAGASAVSRLRLVGTEPGQQLISGGPTGVLDDLLLEARAPQETLAALGGGTLRDSVLSSAASVAEVTGITPASIGLQPTTTLRNDTVEVLGPESTGLLANGSCFPSFTPPFIGCEITLSYSSDFDVANSILRGGT